MGKALIQGHDYSTTIFGDCALDFLLIPCPHTEREKQSSSGRTNTESSHRSTTIIIITIICSAKLKSKLYYSENHRIRDIRIY